MVLVIDRRELAKKMTVFIAPEERGRVFLSDTPKVAFFQAVKIIEEDEDAGKCAVKAVHRH